MSHTLNNTKANTLIIIDEFGKGTTGEEGEALHAAAMKCFINQDVYCPHVLVATHFQGLSRMLPESKFINHLKMNYMVKGNELVFLYKILSGTATSYSFDVAKSLGFDDGIIKRAKEYFRALKNNEDVQPQMNAIPLRYREEINDMEGFLRNINIPEF